MSWSMRRVVQFGDAIVQRTDGTWATDFIMRVLDHEAVPTTEADVEAFVRRDVDAEPVLRAAADAAVVGIADPLRRAVEATRAVHGLGHARAAAWRARRNVSTNMGPGKHPDQ